MFRAHALLITMLLAIVGCSGAPEPRVTTTPWPARFAGPAPGSALLRPGEPARLRTAMGLDSLAQLPRYSVDMALTDLGGHYQGRSTLRFTNTTGGPLESLTLLLHPNVRQELGVATDGGIALLELTCTAGPRCSWQQASPQVVVVTLDPPLQDLERVDIESRFEGTLDGLSPWTNDLFHRAQARSTGSPSWKNAGTGLHATADGLLTIANAHPQLAPFVDGRQRVEEPPRWGDAAWNLPASFDLRVVTPRGLRVVTNLLDGPVEPMNGGMQLTHAQGAGVRELVLVASRDWRVRERQAGGVILRSWFLEQDSPAGEEALEQAAEALELLEAQLGTYPFTELDLVEASLVNAAGMEFSSLVLIAGALVRQPSRCYSPIARRELRWSSRTRMDALSDHLATQRHIIVVHELVHQWVPGLVGVDSLTDAVVDEGLAEYLSMRILGRDLDHEEQDALWDREILLAYESHRDQGGADGAAARPTVSFGSSDEYVALVYSKAAYMYRRLEAERGTAAVDQALRHAVQTQAWGLSDRQRWIQALVQGGLPEAEAAAQHWWDEAHGDEDLGWEPEEPGRITYTGPAEARPWFLEQRLSAGLRELRAALRRIETALRSALQAAGSSPSPAAMLDALDPHGD
jgi:hypothetical protein